MRRWRLRWRLAALVLALTAGSLWLATPWIRSAAMGAIIERVRADFPRAPQISTARLADLLGGEELLLLDVRRADEFAVSRLPGALRVDPGDLDPDLLDEVPASRMIVAYCSVGYRSSRLVEVLREHGFERAVNLEGSIFRWVAEGRPLVNDFGPTAVVHPFGRSWAFMVAPENRAFRAIETGADPPRR